MPRGKGVVWDPMGYTGSQKFTCWLKWYVTSEQSLSSKAEPGLRTCHGVPTALVSIKHKSKLMFPQVFEAVLRVESPRTCLIDLRTSLCNALDLNVPTSTQRPWTHLVFWSQLMLMDAAGASHIKRSEVCDTNNASGAPCPS